MEKEKILIIKAGYCEFLDKENDARSVSLGDVLRTTPILHLFKDHHVTWITDEKAIPLLKQNPFIDRVLRLDFLTLQQLEYEYFDTVINLEKVPGICALTKKVGAWKTFGFRLDERTGEVKAHDKAFEALIVGSDPNKKKDNKKTFQEILFEMLGEKWNGEEYILGPKSSEDPVYDIALNMFIGHKWPTKAWPKKYWDELEQILKKEGFKVTRQDEQSERILTDLDAYINWINSSKLILSNDSLGMHLGLALKKKVIGLFGPTPHTEICFYDRGKALFSESDLDCIPCFKENCEKQISCMENIKPEKVFEEIKNLLSPKSLIDNNPYN